MSGVKVQFIVVDAVAPVDAPAVVVAVRARVAAAPAGDAGPRVADPQVADPPASRRVSALRGSLAARSCGCGTGSRCSARTCSG